MTARSPITTHVLDVALGAPAQGIEVRLARVTGDAVHPVAHGVTDADGRVTTLLAPGTLHAGTYRLSFHLSDYFARTGRVSFYPHADVTFTVVAPDQHYHVPLLLSPFGYSTYRGS